MTRMKAFDEVILIALFLIVILLVAWAVNTFWSLSGMIGLVFLCVSVYIILKRQGNITIAKNQPYLIFLILGLFFIFLSYAGLSIISFEEIPNPLQVFLQGFLP